MTDCQVVLSFVDNWKYYNGVDQVRCIVMPAGVIDATSHLYDAPAVSYRMAFSLCSWLTRSPPHTHTHTRAPAPLHPINSMLTGQAQHPTVPLPVHSKTWWVTLQLPSLALDLLGRSSNGAQNMLQDACMHICAHTCTQEGKTESHHVSATTTYRLPSVTGHQQWQQLHV